MPLDKMSKSTDLSREAIVSAVASHQNNLVEQPLLDPGRDLDWGGVVKDQDLIPAAVLIPLVVRAEGMTVLLTQRTENLRHHPGQISFPGGHIEDSDVDAVAAALREAEEEIGLAGHHVEIVGQMDRYQTGTGFEVTPIVGFVAEHYEWQLDPTEVDEIFEVPMAFIMNPVNHRLETRVIRGSPRRYFVLPYEERYIWGATAGMLVNLYRVLTAQR